MFSARSFARRSAFLVVFALLRVLAFAQETPVPESPEAIKAAVAQHKVDIAIADSTKDVGAAVRLRMALAALSKPKEAQALYEEVVQLADSTGRAEEEFAARKALAETLALRGQLKQAYDEAMHAVEQSTEWSAQQAEASNAKADELVEAAIQQRDSIAAFADTGRREAETRINEAQEAAEFWMMVAIGAVAVALIAVLIVVVMNGRALKRQRDEIQALRSDLGALIDREQNRKREPAVSTPVTPPAVTPPASIVEPIAPPVAVDPMVEAMFRKQAPERLNTLRDARSRGDHEKVQRVVHTLKPQLVNFDPAFAKLCARITDAAAPQSVSWNADLDAFEAGIRRILG